MEIIFEILFSFLGELLLQLFGELLIDFGLRSAVDGETARKHPILSFLGNIVLGLVAGLLSLLIFGHHLLKHAGLRVAMLVVIPPLAGWVMSVFGRWQEKHGGERASLERFWNGFAFALAMGLVRFFWAK